MQANQSAGTQRSERSSVPLYLQIQATLKQRILSGHYGVACALPTEAELCAGHHGIAEEATGEAVGAAAGDGVRQLGQAVRGQGLGERLAGTAVVGQARQMR